MRPGLQERACNSQYKLHSEVDYIGDDSGDDDAGESNLEPQFEVDEDDNSRVDAESKAELSELLGGGGVGGQAGAAAPEQHLRQHTVVGQRRSSRQSVGKVNNSVDFASRRTDGAKCY